MNCIRSWLFIPIIMIVSSCRSGIPRIGRWELDGNEVVESGTWKYSISRDGYADYIDYPEFVFWEDPIPYISNGTFRAYYDNGRIAHICTYSNGVRNGVWEMWHPSGRRYVYGGVCKGTNRGIWLWWDSRGFLNQVSYVMPDSLDDNIFISGDDIKRRTSEPSM